MEFVHWTDVPALETSLEMTAHNANKAGLDLTATLELDALCQWMEVVVETCEESVLTTVVYARLPTLVQVALHVKLAELEHSARLPLLEDVDVLTELFVLVVVTALTLNVVSAKETMLVLLVTLALLDGAEATALIVSLSALQSTDWSVVVPYVELVPPMGSVGALVTELELHVVPALLVGAEQTARLLFLNGALQD